ncbi:hypothetical protein LCGC14_1084250 [marine sediment metagenome]|uniref:Uncharacterized protein n=1 Tax=marine sediment metagenome TaxID=412755 RepID=A0A0F9PXG6_9ZZZZ
MFNPKISKIKQNCIKGLKNIKIEDTKELVSLASDVMALLYYSIRRNGLRRDLLIEDVKEQTNKKYTELVAK